MNYCLSMYKRSGWEASEMILRITEVIMRTVQ